MISDIIFTNDNSTFKEIFKQFTDVKSFVLLDENTEKYCLSEIEKYLPENFQRIKIKSGESNKTLDTVARIWEVLSTKGANRKSLLINLGGGVIGDMGGFAASTFKRGIPFINIPTTLLAQVDASVGGKTGFDFMGLKNEIGCFNAPEKVIIYPQFLKTLDSENILSGFAEMIKHALIHDAKHYEKLKTFNIQSTNFDYDELLQLIKQSVSIKKHFVENDPYEKNIRKALNFGHTFGHAFESYFLGTNKELLHGKAVAFGMIFDAVLSNKKCMFPIEKLFDVTEFITRLYGKLKFAKKDYEKLFTLMQHDKKNEQQQVNFTLLSAIGEVKINQTASKAEIFEAFDYYLHLK
jgi:3-dehydroquinate synthase